MSKAHGNPPNPRGPATGEGEGEGESPVWTEERMIGVAAAVAVVVMGVVLHFRFSGDLALPPRPEPPRAVDTDVLRKSDFTPGIFEEYIKEDVELYGAPHTTAADLTMPFPYELEETKQSLTPGAPALETHLLKLTTRVERLDSSSSRGSMSADHLILKIENKSDSVVAYRIETSPGGGLKSCLTKGDFPHDAIAIAPHEVIERTECLYREHMSFTVDKIETMVLPALSYYYVSRLFPPDIGLDQRATRGHKPPKGTPCQSVPQVAIQVGMQKGTVSWRDVIDYYARHRCDTYIFPSGYRAFTKKGEQRLPVSAETLRAPSP